MFVLVFKFLSSKQAISEQRLCQTTLDPLCLWLMNTESEAFLATTLTNCSGMRTGVENSTYVQ